MLNSWIWLVSDGLGIRLFMGLKDILAILALQDASTDGTAHEASSPSSS